MAVCRAVTLRALSARTGDEKDSKGSVWKLVLLQSCVSLWDTHLF